VVGLSQGAPRPIGSFLWDVDTAGNDSQTMISNFFYKNTDGYIRVILGAVFKPEW
jgi:hypothetical protein